MTTRSGSVRSEAARIAILDATVRLVLQHGYDHLTIEGIAADAGVGKQTIYRWWRSKSALVAECLIEGMLLPEQLAIPNTGDIRRDLIEWISFIFQALGGEGNSSMLRSLVAAATESPEIGDRLREVLAGPESLTGRLESAVGSTPNLQDLSTLDALAEALVGWVILRVLAGGHVPESEIARLVDALLGVPQARTRNADG